jgi:hypothetical protein
MIGGVCACLPVDAGEPPDVSVGDDVSDVTVYPDVDYPDVYYSPDGYYVPDEGPPDAICPPYFCGNGYALDSFCMCVPCTSTCPNGEQPGPGCSGCVACPAKCPANFDQGPNCGCIPHDAGPPPPIDAGDGGGVTCLLEGYYHCNAGAWCQLGTCPDGSTQYGCYCNADGTATCSLSCPVPPPCDIPGEGTCPYGAECVYGSCAGNSSGNVFVCSCNRGMLGGPGNAYCYTASCADGGPFLPDSGVAQDGGATCLIEGYRSCAAGSFCSLGTCPDGTTQYGCFCNADGTANCNLTCPAPPACQIPGEGSCPYGSQCIYGTCNGSSGTELSCYCGYGGYATCNTTSCGNSIEGGVFVGAE